MRAGANMRTASDGLMPSSKPLGSGAPVGDAALAQALELLLAPIATLCLARGLTFPTTQELLKRAFVDAARAAPVDGGAKRDVSRVSTATGLTRREVTRITNEEIATGVVRSTPATQVFTRWLGDRKLRDKQGRPRPLKRLGDAPSFEALAQAVTQDVHPRSLLEELCRLGLADFDRASDTVSLLRDAFVPREDRARIFGFLGSNVGDHLAAAVANVLAAEEPPHLEQAVFADELSDESLHEFGKLVSAQWRTVLAALAPKLDALSEADRKAGRKARRRVRVGLYSYHAAMSAPADELKEP